MLVTNKMQIYSVRKFEEKLKATNEKVKQNPISVTVDIPMYLIRGPAKETLGEPKLEDLVIIELGITGHENKNWRLVGDMGTIWPQYDYKIESYKIRTE
ncbi:MAG TPA: hypothetical protein VIF12_08685, partial [Micavibrio sp.]